jgi:PAS domain S-box-containing protein
VTTHVIVPHSACPPQPSPVDERFPNASRRRTFPIRAFACPRAGELLSEPLGCIRQMPTSVGRLRTDRRQLNLFRRHMDLFRRQLALGAGTDLSPWSAAWWLCHRFGPRGRTLTFCGTRHESGSCGYRTPKGRQGLARYHGLMSGHDPLLELLGAPALRLDDVGVIRAWRDSGREIVWMTDEMAGRSLADVAPPALSAAVAAAMRGGAEETSLPEGRVIRAAPGVWLLVLKNAHRGAAEGRQRMDLRELLRNIAAIVWTVDSVLRPVFLAGDTVLITGYTHDEIQEPGTDAIWVRAVHPDDLDRVLATHAGIFRTFEPFDVEYRYRRKDGSWVWLNDRAFHVYTRDGMQYVDGVTYDVTQRKRDEQQQIAAAEFGRRAVQSAETGALLEDACETVRTTLAVDSASALWFARDLDRFTFAGMAGRPVPLPGDVPLDSSTLASYAYRSDQGVAYEDLRTETRFRAPTLLEGGFRSGISVPLRGGAVRYGVLSAHATEPRRFSERECAFVETIATSPPTRWNGSRPSVSWPASRKICAAARCSSPTPRPSPTSAVSSSTSRPAPSNGPTSSIAWSASSRRAGPSTSPSFAH